MLFKDKHLQSSATNTTDFCRSIKQRHASIPACTLLALRACIYACVSNDAIETQVVRAAPPLMCVLGNYCCDEGRLAQFPSPLRPPFFSLPVFMKKACTGSLTSTGRDSCASVHHCFKHDKCPFISRACAYPSPPSSHHGFYLVSFSLFNYIWLQSVKALQCFVSLNYKIQIPMIITLLKKN